MNSFQILEEKLGKGRVKIDEPLSLHTTFQIGGPADYYFEAGTVEELVKAVELAGKLAIPYYVLGGGSNILVGDKGFRGLVIRNKSKEIKILAYKGEVKSQKSKVKSVLIKVDSGVPFNQLVRFTLEEGLGGLEEFLGLPGTVGGAIIDNAHWQGKKVNDLLVSSRCLAATPLGCAVILKAVFRLAKGEKEQLWEEAKKAVEYRQRTQPQKASAGCTFRNIKKSEALRIGTPNLTTSAGFLIEALGLKGLRVGNVQVSTVHANFIVNLGGGSASDVLELIELVKSRVKEKFNVFLKEEIVKVGEF